MRRILYGISPIGLGHATRSLGIIRILEQSGADVRVVSGGNAARFLKTQGFAVEDAVSDPVPRVVAGEMKDAFWWYVRSWRAFRRTKFKMARIFGQFRPDLVVGDEEFSSLSLALDEGLPCVLISDELELGFARNRATRWLERRVLRWYMGLQSRVSMIIVPEDGADYGNVRHVDPIVRRPTMSRSEVVAEHGLPSEGTMILLSMSGSGMGEHLMKGAVSAISSLPDAKAFLVVTGNRGRRLQTGRVYDLGVISDNQNLISAADLVISLGGKSTIDEAAAYGTPIIAIPLKNHAEQQRNAAALGFRFEDKERLPALVAGKVGNRGTPLRWNGAERAAELILSVAGRGGRVKDGRDHDARPSTPR